MLQTKQMQPVKQIQQAKQDILQWFYEQAKEHRLTGTAQRFWYWLFTQLSMVQPDRFYEISSRTLAAELGVCLKSIERSRKALQQAGLLHYEVRGKSVYYRLLLPETDRVGSGAISAEKRTSDAPQTFSQTSVDPAQQIAELTVKLEEYAQQIAQLQAQLLKNEQQTCRGRYHLPADEVNTSNDTTFTNSKDYTAYKQAQQKQNRQPDILFNDKYEILLWDYLNKYKDSRFNEACCNHFTMLKELYQRKGKKKLTEAGFHNIMNQLEQLSGNDMTLKLAIMERSLRNNWAGFFSLPDNTPEHKKAEQKKQGHKRSSYRHPHSRSHYDKIQPREGRDLEYLVQ